MIRCFKCGYTAEQNPDGTIQWSCTCYQPGLVYQGTIENRVTGAQPCPFCKELVFVQAYHRCRRSHDTLPASQPLPDEIDTIRARNIHAMITDQIIVHKAKCPGCKILGRSCVEIIPVEDLQEKWKKKAGIK